MTSNSLTQNKAIVTIINILLIVIYIYVLQFVLFALLGLLEGMGLLYSGAVTAQGSILATVVEIASIACVVMAYVFMKDRLFISCSK